MSTNLRWMAVAAVLPAALVISGCDKTIDSGDLEKKITENINTQVKQKVKVDCPGDITAKKGKVLTCTITLANGSTAKAIVTLQDDNGKFSYTVPSSTGGTTTTP